MLPSDVLAVRSAGACGFVQASNYNARPRAVEVLVWARSGASFAIATLTRISGVERSDRLGRSIRPPLHGKQFPRFGGIHRDSGKLRSLGKDWIATRR